MLRVSEQWKNTYPGSMVGVLVLRGINNRESPPYFLEARRELETRLRERYAGYNRQQLKTDPVLSVYGHYYAEFRKTYHLLLQLETVAFDGKPISGPSPLVEAMFMAELDNKLLTAGHDFKHVRGKLEAELASGEEVYTGLGNRRRRTKSGDMLIRDEEGILSSVIYGPDHRTRIREDTTDAIFTVYCPAGISRETLREHLRDIERYGSLLAGEASRDLFQIYPQEG